MSLQLDSLRKSIDSLERSVKTASRIDDSDEDLQEAVRAGVIQHFEVAYELSWKMLKRWLKENIGAASVDGVTQRNLFRLGAENRLIADVERWMEYHNARNSTSHTYDEDAALNVFTEATEFVHDVKHLLKMLEARND
ncbi:MAG: nucleotidyltransferase substrate binding protein [Candidatus Poribacteria bacterium]|nr:nucleotidyltransferase substrate binding protein [Candidatus Poribacteria bacterium]MDE0483418.1 nucleotidyltransferase substrate binding protein [Candidatus Poribacteria bacterium]